LPSISLSDIVEALGECGMEHWGRYTDPAFLILASLGGGAKHGYAIMEDIKAETGVAMGPGTLYAALNRLEERRWIEAIAGDARRRPYRLTDLGTEALAEQARHYHRIAHLGLKRLGLAGLNGRDTL
jgi:DNA-binding PadR family transcriptional regulator